MKIIYTAWIKDEVGVDEEVVKVAVNQVYAASDHSVKDDDEIILFPPIAGG